MSDPSPSLIEVDDTPARYKSARGHARALIVQSLYAMRLTGNDPMMVRLDVEGGADFKRTDKVYFREVWAGIVPALPALEALFESKLDRTMQELSPIERSILLLGTWELRERIDIPYRVVINEAVELAKRFGGTDGHKYVNGVLDQLAPALRAAEVEQYLAQHKR
jgi:transcription antitermination protein NusB